MLPKMDKLQIQEESLVDHRALWFPKEDQKNAENCQENQTLSSMGNL